jgi:hypothetical protein
MLQKKVPNNFVKFEVLTVVLLSTQVFCNADTVSLDKLMPDVLRDHLQVNSVQEGLVDCKNSI